MSQGEKPGGSWESDVAVVIPCYNEAPTVAAVVSDFAVHLPGARIFVFDNNSTDGTAERAREAGAIVIHSPRQGKGHVLRHATDVVDADVIITVDGDGTYPAHAAPKLIEKLERDHLDMVVATRLERHEAGAFPPLHRLGNRILSGLISLLFGTRLTDVLSGYRALARSCSDLVRLRRPGFEVETELTLQCLSKGLAIGEMPVEYRRRIAGSQSKLSTWTDGFLILRCILLIFKDYRPLLFYGGLAAIFGAASLVVGSAPIRDFLEYRYVLHVPRAILAAALAIFALVWLTAGIILDTISKYHADSMEVFKRVLRKR